MNKCIKCQKRKSKRNKYFCSLKCYLNSDLHKGTQFQFGHQGLDQEKNPAWRGGKHYDGKYIKISIGKKKYIREHRLTMEKYLGRKLSPIESIHHLNGNTTDNRIENLVLNNNESEHQKQYHQPGWLKI